MPTFIRPLPSIWNGGSLPATISKGCGNVLMQKALAASPDVRFQKFLDRVMTPKYRRASLATIAKGCGIDLLEFNQWWGKASAQRAIAEAQLPPPA